MNGKKFFLALFVLAIAAMLSSAALSQTHDQENEMNDGDLQDFYELLEQYQNQNQQFDEEGMDQGYYCPTDGQVDEDVDAVVRMRTGIFNPSSISVEEGDTVLWINDDRVPHTVTGFGVDKFLYPGQTFKHTFRDDGSFHYICMLHPNMHGQVIVNGDDDEPEIPGITVITIDNMKYSDNSVEIEEGERVRWVNKDNVAHSVTGFGFNKLLQPDDSFTLRFNRDGTYYYVNMLHPELFGKIIVNDADGDVEAADEADQDADQDADEAVDEESDQDSTDEDSDVDDVSDEDSTDEDSDEADEDETQTLTVSMDNNLFLPENVNIEVGDTIRWVNNDDIDHTVTGLG